MRHLDRQFFGYLRDGAAPVEKLKDKANLAIDRRQK